MTTRAVRGVDLNVDAGEGFDDARLLAAATSVNIACGGHTGDERTMAAAIAAAIRAGCAIGAHPSYPDRIGFGRRSMVRSPAETAAETMTQSRALSRLCAAAAAPMCHVKPHGALYHAAWRDPGVAGALAEAIARLDRSLWVYAPPGSALEAAARSAGLAVAREGFADRGVSEDGGLVARGEPGAVVADPAAAAARAVAWVREGRVTTASGAWLAWPVDTLCVHGDTPNADAILGAVRSALEADGLAVEAVGAAFGRA